MVPANDLPLRFRQSPLEVVVRLVMGDRQGHRPPGLAPDDRRRLAEQVRPAGMLLEPFLQDAGQERRQWNPSGGRLALHSLLLVDEDGLPVEVHVRHLGTEHLGPPRPCVGREAEQGVDPRLGGFCPDVPEDLLDLRQGKVQGVPEFALLLLGQVAGLGPPLDLLPGLERRLLLRSGVPEPAHRELACEEAHWHAPVPSGPQRHDLLADRRRRELPSETLHPGAAVHVALEIRERELLHREPLPERPNEVLEVELDAVEGGLLQASIPMGGEVLVAQLAQGEAAPVRRLFLWHLAIKLNKRHNIGARRKVQQALFEAHQEVVHLVRFDLCLVWGDLSEAERMAFPVVEELAVPRFALLVNGGHCCTCWRCVFLSGET